VQLPLAAISVRSSSLRRRQPTRRSQVAATYRATAGSPGDMRPIGRSARLNW